VLWKSKIVILDEPTAALGVAQTEQVLELVRQLAGQGVAVILVSHNMNDVMKVADSIGVLFLGRMAAQVRRADLTQTQVVELMTLGCPPPSRPERPYERADRRDRRAGRVRALVSPPRVWPR
jgi:D-xylose transport system ATP-binding protein